MDKIKQYNIKILNYNTNKWIITPKEIKAALKEIIINQNTNYSYNRTTARMTANLLNIKF